MDEPLARGRPRARPSGSGSNLHDTLVSLGVAVETMTPQPGLPDLVFTANAGLDLPQTRSSAAASGTRCGPASRRTSTPGSRDTASRSSTCRRACSTRGPATPCSAARRSSPATASAATPPRHQWVGETLGVRVLPLELVNPRFYHLDTCFCPLAPGEAIYFPDAFDAYGQRVLETHVPKLIAVDEAEAFRFGCNAVVVGKTVVHNSRCPQLAAEPDAGRLQADRGRAGRVPQGRRQREVPDAAAGRRRSGGVEGERSSVGRPSGCQR